MSEQLVGTVQDLVRERDELRAENVRLMRDLMTVKQQLEYVLASIRKTYDTVRGQQDREIARIAREVATDEWTDDHPHPSHLGSTGS
jgi:hypothetical protein